MGEATALLQSLDKAMGIQIECLHDTPEMERTLPLPPVKKKTFRSYADRKRVGWCKSKIDNGQEH